MSRAVTGCLNAKALRRIPWATKPDRIGPAVFQTVRAAPSRRPVVLSHYPSCRRDAVHCRLVAPARLVERSLGIESRSLHVLTSFPCARDVLSLSLGLPLPHGTHYLNIRRTDRYPRGRIVFRRFRWLQLVALLVLAARRSTLTKTVTVNGAVIGIIDTIYYTVPVAVIAEDSWLYGPISLSVSSGHSVVPTLPIKRRLGSKAG
jgi:hypothetical protein